MRAYEALVIVDSALEEADIERAVERFLDVIKTSGGEVTNVDKWGTRRFAYEIDHRKEGYYFVAAFRAEEQVVDDLKRTVQISDEFIRSKIVRPEAAR